MNTLTKMQAVAILVIVAFASVAHAAEGILIRSSFSYVPSSEDQLRRAASSGNLAEMRRLLGAGARMNSSDPDGFTPLIAAVGADQPEAVSLLLQRGADVNHKSPKTGHTALTYAAVLGYGHLIDALIQAGANTEVRNRSGRTPLMEAALRGYVSATQLLLANGANPGAKDRRGRTALAMANFAGHREVASLLITRGAATDSTDKKRTSRASDESQLSQPAASAGTDWELGSANGSPANCTDTASTRRAHKSRLGELDALRRSSVLTTGAASNLIGIAPGCQGSMVPIPENLDLLAAMAAAKPQGLNQARDGRDYRNLEALAKRASSTWEQLQSNHPEVAAALQARMPDLARFLRPGVQR